MRMNVLSARKLNVEKSGFGGKKGGGDLDIRSLGKLILVSGSDGVGLTTFSESISNGCCTILSTNPYGVTDYNLKLKDAISSYLKKNTDKPLIVENSDSLFDDSDVEMNGLLNSISQGNTPVIFRTKDYSVGFRRDFSRFFEHVYLGYSIDATDSLKEQRRAMAPGDVLDSSGKKVVYSFCSKEESEKNTVYVCVEKKN